MIATRGTRLYLPARKEGILPGASNLRLPRSVGDRLARQAILSGLEFEAGTPHGDLLCDEVVESPKEMDDAVARRVAALTSSGLVNAAEIAARCGSGRSRSTFPAVHGDLLPRAGVLPLQPGARPQPRRALERTRAPGLMGGRRAGVGKTMPGGRLPVARASSRPRGARRAAARSGRAARAPSPGASEPVPCIEPSELVRVGGDRAAQPVELPEEVLEPGRRDDLEDPARLVARVPEGVPLVPRLEDEVTGAGLDDVVTEERPHPALEDVAVLVLARVPVQRGGERARRHRVLDEREALARVDAVDQEADADAPEEAFLPLVGGDDPRDLRLRCSSRLSFHRTIVSREYTTQGDICQYSEDEHVRRKTSIPHDPPRRARGRDAQAHHREHRRAPRGARPARTTISAVAERAACAARPSTAISRPRRRSSLPAPPTGAQRTHRRTPEAGLRSTTPPSARRRRSASSTPSTAGHTRCTRACSATSPSSRSSSGCSATSTGTSRRSRTS